MDVYEDRKKEMKSSRFVSFLIVNLETAIDKKHNRAGPGQIYGKYRRFRAGSTEFNGK